MAQLKLSDGENLIILNESADIYIAKVDTSTSPFTKKGVPVFPTEDVCEADGAQKIWVNESAYILDAAGVQYARIVGSRPRTRARR